VNERDDPFAQNTIFHPNCRGIWVAILQDEQDPPAVRGIPQSMRGRLGDAVNDLIQPKTPRPKKAELTLWSLLSSDLFVPIVGRDRDL
jgi:hypothetical protein